MKNCSNELIGRPPERTKPSTANILAAGVALWILSNKVASNSQLAATYAGNNFYLYSFSVKAEKAENIDQ